MKDVRFSRQATSLGFAAALGFGVALGVLGERRASAQTPPAPPPPPAPNATPGSLQTPGAASPLPSGVPVPTVSPSESPAPSRRGRRRSSPNASPSASPSANPEPTSTPTSPAFSTLDGTWELQVQHPQRTEYSYLIIAQTGTSALSGSWRVNGKEYPFSGTYDGRLIRMVVKQPAGAVTLSGYVEGASDMVGLIDFGVAKTDPTAFTAEHRGSRTSVFKKKP